MDSLIKRLEVSLGPCRELDCGIALAVDGGEIVWKTANGTMETYPARRYPSANHIGGYGNAPVPRYTESIDAALTLVDDGAGLELLRYWIAGVEGPVWMAKICTGGVPDNPRRVFDAWDAPTPALAIVIAALKARGGRDAGS